MRYSFGFNYKRKRQRNTTVSNLAYGENLLSWTITKDGCSATDTVLITNNLPSPALAGSDQVLCADSTLLYANIPLYGTGQWTLISGSGVFENRNSNNTKVKGLNLGKNTLRWVTTKNGCTNYTSSDRTN